MEQVELKVKVIDAELNALEQKINALKSQKVNLNVKSSGVEAASEGFKQGAKNLKVFSDAATEAGNASGTLANNISKFTTWYLIGGAVSGAIRSFKEAVSTMKEVDTQLTNIQKVSQMTTDEIERIGDAAYETASKYGVAADEYLSAVYTFQKAGLGDSAEQMGELATKTMLVGDTTADVASKFLIAVNAAWGLNGSISELSKVVDEADYINNNYATDLEKLSSGMPIVASTAANMNMSIEETLAVLGTITSATQETGTKAATAWRALVMNITGEIGEITDEVDGNIEVTEESVKRIADALKIYGNEAVKTAQQTGQVIDPMEAVISLAEAYKDGLLTDIELENILMDVGGKLRTNQLTALVKDLASETSTYYDILANLPNAAGTADSEISTMLSSWESKTQILKNTWTEFISNLISTDAVKGGLDVLIGIVDALDSGFVKFAVTIGAATAAMSLLVKAFTAVKASAFVSTLTGMLASTEAFRAGLALLTETMLASPLFWAAAATAAIYGIVKAVDALTVSSEELRQKIAEVNSEYETQMSEIAELESKGLDNLTDAERVRLAVLKEQTAELQKQQKKLEEQALKAYKKETHEYTVAVSNPWAPGAKNYYKAEMQNEAYANSLIKIAEAENTLEALTNDERIALSEYVSVLLDAKDAGVELTDADEDLISSYTKLIKSNAKLNKEQENTTSAAKEETAAAKEAVSVYDEFQNKTAIVIQALSELNDSNVIQKSTLDDLLRVYPELEGEIKLTADGYVIEKSKLDDLISSRRADYKTTLDNAATAAQAQISALHNESIAWSENTGEILKNLKARATALRADANAYIKERVEGGDEPRVAGNSKTVQGILDEALEYDKAIAAVEAYQAAKADLSDYDSYVISSLGGWNKDDRGSTKKTDTELEKRKETVELLKSELSLYRERGDEESAQVEKMREIQNALHDEAEYLRSIGAAQAEINALSEEWWKYQNEISELLETSLRGELERMQSEEESALQSKIDALEAQNKAKETAVTLAEKELAVEKALDALQNARTERTVRQYNASAGQWEWGAKASDIQKAEEDYESAVNDLADYRSTMEKQALEDELNALKTRYDDLNTALDALIKAVASGAMGVEAAVSAAASAGVPVGGSGLGSYVTEKMKANSAAWYGADDAGRKALADENAALGASMGWTRKADGAWYTADGTRAYDTGGILTGIGGIKATQGKEMVLPPDLTGRMLSPQLTSAAQDRFAELRWLYGGGARPSSVAGTRIENQHNGNVYNMNGYTIPEQQAKSMSVYDFVRMSRGLGIYKSTN